MRILTDREIKSLAKEGAINPFVSEKVSKNVISYGLNSYGYDIRLSNEFGYFEGSNFDGSSILDPKNFEQMGLRKMKIDEVIIPSNDFVLGMSIEYFKMPKDVIGICVGKSTYARCGVIVNVTPLEPGWEGKLVIEISNSGSLPVKIYANEGIAQIIFIECQMCERPYVGLYQKQINSFGKSII